MRIWKKDNFAATAMSPCGRPGTKELGRQDRDQKYEFDQRVFAALWPTRSSGRSTSLERGGTLEQETRRWDDVRGRDPLMRVKESAHDYRYFPDPDLLPVKTAFMARSGAPP